MNREEIFLLRGFLPMEGDVLLPCPSDSYPMVFLLFSILGGKEGFFSPDKQISKIPLDSPFIKGETKTGGLPGRLF